jgi:hypothetical protein
MGFWGKSRRVFKGLCDNGRQSVRRIAQDTGLSKSSVHRLKQAMERRDGSQESWGWETEAGHGWLLRLVVAPLSIFGLKRGVGADSISAFFCRLRLESHVGCAPSAVRGVMEGVEHAILETTTAGEQEGMAHGETRPVIGAVDETFLARRMLVCMDLVSGYLLVAEVAEERSEDTWPTLVKARLATLGVRGFSLVSDRAKALITLAETGLECLSIPDVLHLLPDLVKGYALALCSRLRQAPQALKQAQERLATCQASHPGSPALQRAQALVETRDAEGTYWANVPSVYRHPLTTMSLLVHPWCLVDSRRQTSADVERPLHAETRAIEAFITTSGLPVKKQTLDKVRKQLAGVSALVDVWWQRVWQDVQHHVDLPPAWRQWIAEVLLPRMDWQAQLSRTRCPRRTAKRFEAWAAVQTACDRPPITVPLAPAVRRGWETWASEHAKAFQRASSAVEGRNGSVSPMQHNHRGVPKGRSKVWTVLHNFDCRASDGTTPASRFFRRDFPDLFETVLSQIEELPRARRRNQTMA